MPSVLILATYALAVARITRLITDDKIAEGLRNLVYRRTTEGSLAAYLVSCRWCVSVWVALPVAPIAYWWGERPWFLIPALALAFSHITGMLSGWEER